MSPFNKEEKMKIVNKLAERYRKASKKQKSIILKEFIHLTNYHPKYAAWLMRNCGRKIILKRKGKPLLIIIGEIKKKRKILRRKKIYDGKVLSVLKFIWRVMSFPCGKRLAPILGEIIPLLEKRNEIKIDEEIKGKLLKISPSTIDRMLKEEKKKLELKKRRNRRAPGSLLKAQIPIRTFSEWENTPPGFIDVDLVSHSGGNPRGDFIHTLCGVDIATEWVGLKAVKNKARIWTFDALEKMEREIPFSIKGIHSDNGVEFINEHLFNYCKDTGKEFTRSRPYRKNDNCHIEQKNGSCVRKFVGHSRYETQEELDILNELYHYLTIYINFFQPTMKLVEKVRVGSKVRRKYDKPKTPYQRVLISNHISQEVKEKLKAMYTSLDLIEIWKKIYQLTNKLFDMQEEKEQNTCFAKNYYIEFREEIEVMQ